MKLVKIDPNKPDDKVIEYTTRLLRKGGVIIYPTDTLYGLGVDVQNVRAMERLYRIKNRNYSIPVSLMVSSLDHIEDLIGLLPIEQHSYLKRLLPGPVTIILSNKRRGRLQIIHRALDMDTIGFRIPDHPFCIRLAQKLDRPITTTSANKSGENNIADIKELINTFGSEIDLILDGGPLKKAAGSTIIDFTKQPYLIRREGELKIKDLRRILPKVKFEVRKTKYRVTFICSGNICRSAMAKVMMEHLIAKNSLSEFIEVDSAGTLHMPVQPAHIYAVQTLEKNGLDLHLHKSKSVSPKIMEESELIICMARNHFDDLNNHFPQYKDKIMLIKQWGRKEKLANPSVADPIGHEPEFFDFTFKEIQNELKRIFPIFKEKLKEFAVYNDLNCSR